MDSTNEGDVKLWDTRKASVPYMYLTAHISRIYSLDWSFHDKDQLVTSAQDCFVKFFNVQGGLQKIALIIVRNKNSFDANQICTNLFYNLLIGILLRILW